MFPWRGELSIQNHHDDLDIGTNPPWDPLAESFPKHPKMEVLFRNQKISSPQKMERIRIRRKTTVKLLLLPFFGQKHHVPTLMTSERSTVESLCNSRWNGFKSHLGISPHLPTGLMAILRDLWRLLPKWKMRVLHVEQNRSRNATKLSPKIQHIYPQLKWAIGGMENPPFSTENRRNFIYRKTFFSNLLFQSSVVQLENKPIGSQLLMRTGKVLDVSCLEHEGFQRNPFFFCTGRIWRVSFYADDR